MKRSPSLALALLAAVHGPAAAFGPAGLPANLSALRLQGVRVAAGDVPGVPAGTAVGAQSSWQDLVRFSDQPNPHVSARTFKAWQPAEKQLILRHVGWVVQNQPGLWARCAANGPLTFHRAVLAGAGGIDNATANRLSITFQDRFFAQAALPNKLFDRGLQIVIHELVHVADVELALSSRQDWRAAVEKPVRDFRTQAPSLASEGERAVLALTLGLVRPYAAELNLTETLADLASFAALEPAMRPQDWANLTIAPAALAFIRSEVLSTPRGPGLAAALVAAIAHKDAGDRRAAYDAYTRAIALEPRSEVAYVRRAQLALRDPALPATGLADLDAARPLLSEFGKLGEIFYLEAVDAGAKAGRYPQVLQDCSAAAARGLEHATLHLSCGRVRMMDTLTRSVRRQISPEERDRNYRQALEELRRAKVLSPGLANTIEPLERQLEGLLTPKPAA